MQPDYLPYARQCIEQDDIDAVVRVLKSDFLTSGPCIVEFEEALAESVQADWAVAVGSGTEALHAACFAAGVGPGDEVIVPAVTFVASANCARYLGAEPVFADVDADTGLIQPSEVERLLSPRTRAIVVVHLAGAPVDLDAIRALAESAGVTLIEDAAHALGAEHAGVPIGGGASAMSTFSFHAIKHITTGEGGAVTGSDPELRERLRLIRNQGIVRGESLQRETDAPWYYEQQALGHNMRMTDIQAALGTSQLRKLPRFVDRRRALARRYDEGLRELAGVTPVVRGAAVRRCAYHLYSVLVEFAELGIERQHLMNALRARGVGTQVHYIPVPWQPYYASRGWADHSFAGAESYYERTLSLPLFPAMSDADVDRVVSTLASVIEAQAGIA